VAGRGAAFGGLSWMRPDGGATRQTKAQIDYAVEQSLKRLNTDYLDLYQLHWPDRPVRVFGGQTFKDYEQDFEAFGDILEALDAHVKKGTIRAIGVSNEFPWGVMRFLAEAEAKGLPRIASIQNAYHLANRTFEYGLAEIAMREQVGLLAYSPLAQGALTGKYLDGKLPAGSRKALYNRMQRYEGPGAEPAIRGYVDLAAHFGVDPAQLALKFCDTREFVTATIIGATSMDQLKTNIAAFDLAWTEAVNALHASSPIRRPYMKPSGPPSLEGGSSPDPCCPERLGGATSHDPPFHRHRHPAGVGDHLLPRQHGIEGARWRPREAFHITLKFIGDVQETGGRRPRRGTAGIARPGLGPGTGRASAISARASRSTPSGPGSPRAPTCVAWPRPTRAPRGGPASSPRPGSTPRTSPWPI
jgi:aryl-alcohol dehydrogenase-like predicted oxidoreductase